MWARVRAFVPALAWAALVWFIGGLQHIPVTTYTSGLDKLAHFAMYGVLGWLCARGWLAGGGRGLAAVLITLALLMGAADEWRQAQLTTRSAELADWLADAAGVLTGFYVAVLFARKRQRI